MKRTLSREVSFRPIEDEDIKYVWAAYRKGALTPLGERFSGGEMSGEEFKEAFTNEVFARFNGVWVVSGPVLGKGNIAIGIVFGFYHERSSPFMTVGGVAWFPWATKRNIVEGTIFFFNKVRHEIPMMLYANEQQKRLYEVAAMHGIMRRVGTSMIALSGEPAAVFETRAKG